jgi:predicted Zn-dependent protease
MVESKIVLSSNKKIPKNLQYLMFPESLKSHLNFDDLLEEFKPEFVNSFEKVNKDNIFGNEIEQSVDHYILSKKRRRKPEPEDVSEKKIVLSKILLTQDLTTLEKYQTIIEAVKTLMENYFQLKVEIDTELQLKIKKNKNSYHIFDQANQIKHRLNFNKAFKNFDIFCFLEILPKFIRQGTLSFVCFTDVNLHEGNPKIEIFGRVLNLSKNFAVVSLNNDLDSETMITALHETMHTFGLSHCKSWNCLMNAKNDNNYSCIGLCPLDLIKLKVFNPQLDFAKRYKDMEQSFKELGWGEDEKEMRSKCLLISKNK